MGLHHGPRPSGNSPFVPDTSGLDPYFDNVVLLLKGEGPNASETIFDSSKYNSYVQSVNGAQSSTALSKYGTGSLKFDGTNDYLKIPKSTQLALGTGDLTVEMWVYITNSNLQAWYSHYSGPQSTSGVQVGLYQSNMLLWSFGNGSSFAFYRQVSVTVALNTWHHVAITRSGTTARLFFNGVQVDTISNSTNVDQGTATYIGGAPIGYTINGYIDELRVTKGVARYTEAFTPPTQSFVDYGGGTGVPMLATLGAADKTFVTPSAIETFFLSPDGLKLFFISYSTSTIFQYSLSTKWDISTATSGSSLVITPQLNGYWGAHIRPDGLIIYVMNTAGTIFQYNLTTPWDLSTCSYSGISYTPTNNPSFRRGFDMSWDGTKYYMIDPINDGVFQWNMSTPWLLSSSTYAGRFNAPSGANFNPQGVRFYNARSMYVHQQSSVTSQWKLTTDWEVISATPTLVFNGTPTGGIDMWFSPNGQYLFALEGGASNIISRYPITTLGNP